MEEKKITTPAIKALIISLVLIVLSVAVITMNQMGNNAWNLASFAVYMLGIIWACISFSKQMDANVTFGNVFSHGFKTSAGVAALLALWIFVSMKFIFPDAMDSIAEIQRAAMEKQGLSENDIDNAMERAKGFTMPLMVVGSVFMYLVVGAISALIGASIAKKNPNTNMPA